MKKLKIVFLSLLGSFGILAFANFCFADDAYIEKKIKEKFPEASVDSIEKFGKLELFEIVINGSIYYTDSEFKYLIDGNMIELGTMRNITEQRSSELEAEALKRVQIKFEDLPLKNAIKRVYGSGKRKIAYFADPNCGYCKKFDTETIANLKDATLYLFLYPIISQRSIPLSKSIWCAKDPAAAWDNYVLHGKSPKDKSGDCKDPIDATLAFGKDKRIRATPTLFFADGSRVSGALTLEQLEGRFSKVQK